MKSDRSHANSFIGVGDEVSIIVSNSKDEAWSQYEHLHDFGRWIHKASKYLKCQWSRVLLKWRGLVRCRYHHRLAYRKLRTEIGELKGRNNNKTRLEVGVEREIIGNRIEIKDEPREVKKVSFYQHRKTIPDGPSCWWSLQFAEMFYSNPDCKTQCENLPCSSQYPGQHDPQWYISLKIIATYVSTGKDILLWHSYHKPDALKFWAHNWSLPPDAYPMLINAQITPRTAWIGKKVTTRNTNTCLDRWYMAYNRAIMMTWMKYQLSEYHWYYIIL